MRRIHTSIVSRHITTKCNNKILRTSAPHINISEEIRPRLTRRNVAQLRTNKLFFLKVHVHKVDVNTHPSLLCPLCNTHSHDRTPPLAKVMGVGGEQQGVIRNNSIIYTVSVLVASIAASILLLSAGTRRVFPVEIILSRYVAQVSAMCIVSSILSNCSSSVCSCGVCGLLIGWHWFAGRDRFVRFTDVATGKSCIDGTNGFVYTLVVCCETGTTFAGFDFLLCIVYGVAILAVGFVLTSSGCSMVAGVVMGINVFLKRVVSPLPVRSMGPMRLSVV